MSVKHGFSDFCHQAISFSIQYQDEEFLFNPYLTNGLSHHYQLDESTFILGVLGVIFISYLIFR